MNAKQEARHQKLTEQYYRQRDIVYKRPVTLTIDDLFKDAPEGEFEWRDSEAGDWHVFNCGEKDCPVQWHRAAYGMDMGRNADGKRWIELTEVDSDGNWETTDGWEEGEDPYSVLLMLSRQSDEYFLGWMDYWLACAEAGEELLKDSWFIPRDYKPATVGEMLDEATANLRYLEMRK